MLAILLFLAQGDDLPRSLADDGIAGWRVDARVRAHHPAIRGGLKGEHDESTFDLHEDLDLDSPGWTPAYELAWLWSGEDGYSVAGIGVSGSVFSTSGTNVLESSQYFQDHLFPAGSVLESRFRFMEFGVHYIWASRWDTDDLFGYRAEIGVHYLEAEVHLRGPLGSESEEYSDGNGRFALDAEIRPTEWFFAGVHGAVYTDVLSLLGGADSGHYAGEFGVYGGFQVGPARLEGGYNVFGWTLTWWASEIDLVTYGPSVGFSMRF